MQTRTLDLELKDLPNDQRLFAKYSYWSIFLIGRKKEDRYVNVPEIDLYVQRMFRHREKRKDPPYYSDFDEFQSTRLLIDGLAILIEKGIIEFNEESGRYKALK